MVLKLIGFPGSTCSRRVATILKEKQVPYEFVSVDITKGEQKASSYLEKQPFGQVPYIEEEDGFILYESRAIAKYIALKYRDQGTPLIPDPSDLKATGLLEQAISIESANFDAFAYPIAIERVFKPRRGGVTDENQVKEKLAGLEGKLDGYEKILSKQKYLAGDNVTLADLYHLPYGSLLVTIGIDVFSNDKRPNVARWWKDITSRQSWQTVKDRADAV